MKVIIHNIFSVSWKLQFLIADYWRSLLIHNELNSMFRSWLVNTFVTHAIKEGFGLTTLSGDRSGYMPPLLKKNKTTSHDKM